MRADLVQDAARRAGGGADGLSQRGERAWTQIGCRAGGEDIAMRGNESALKNPRQQMTAATTAVDFAIGASTLARSQARKNAIQR
ncbi:hypothetical protein, partial [Xanthomonas translucens]|uniref:hypothetical protein n=1 Tax=Xanthomonas campestris pv. translucens TaxID=343 RepID=UPI002B411232